MDDTSRSTQIIEFPRRGRYAAGAGSRSPGAGDVASRPMVPSNCWYHDEAIALEGASRAASARE